MKRFIIMFLIAVLCSVSFGAQSNLKIGTLQFLGGLAGEACCLVPAFSLWQSTNWWAEENQEIEGLAVIMVLGLYLATPLASADGVRLVGDHYYNKPERGSFGYSVLGAYIGGITAIGVLVAAKVEGYPIYLTAIPAINIGAVMGYQLSRHKTAQHSFLNDHLQSPSLGLKLEKDKTGKTISALDIRLINARF